jgi:hypothetical protein
MFVAVLVPLWLWLDNDPTFNRARALGLISGGSIGYLFQMRFAPFLVRSSWPVQLGKLGLGIIGVVVFYLGLSALLPDTSTAKFIQAAAAGLWAFGGAPWLFGIVWGRPRTHGRVEALQT